MSGMTHLMQGTQPAGGAALGEVILASTAAGLLTAALLVLGLGHRSGRVALLGRLAARSERISGLPGWASLPAGIATASLLTAVFGMYWDIALHIGVGRDEGPLANPAHYFILAGLFGIFTATRRRSRCSPTGGHRDRAFAARSARVGAAPPVGRRRIA
jgi:hypothetical protein